MGVTRGGEPDTDEDRRLVRAFLRRRDERAFRALYRRHTPALYALALRLAGDPADAEDVVQEMWVQAVAGLSRFEGRSSLRTWLKTIAARCWWRRARGRARWAGPAVVETAAAEDPVLRGAADRVAVERAVAGLPDGYREVFVLHDVEGFTHAEIGALLGIEVGTSKSQLSRARRALRAALDGIGGGKDGAR